MAVTGEIQTVIVVLATESYRQCSSVSVDGYCSLAVSMFLIKKHLTLPFNPFERLADDFIQAKIVENVKAYKLPIVYSLPKEHADRICYKLESALSAEGVFPSKAIKDSPVWRLVNPSSLQVTMTIFHPFRPESNIYSIQISGCATA